MPAQKPLPEFDGNIIDFGDGAHSPSSKFLSLRRLRRRATRHSSSARAPSTKSRSTLRSNRRFSRCPARNWLGINRSIILPPPASPPSPCMSRWVLTRDPACLIMQPFSPRWLRPALLGMRHETERQGACPAIGQDASMHLLRQTSEARPRPRRASSYAHHRFAIGRLTVPPERR